MEKKTETEKAEKEQTIEFWFDVFESATRVSLATVGGSVAGYGMGARMEGYGMGARTEGYGMGAHKEGGTTGSSLSLNVRRRRPPAPSSGTFPSQRIASARGWGLSCFVFALILETSRLASPTTALFERFGHVKLGDANRETKMVRKALTAVGDYAFGGLAAGIAGARALSNSKLRLGFPIYLRGGVYGSLLGLVGGLAQAALEVIKLYEEEEPHHDDPKAATDAAKK